MSFYNFNNYSQYDLYFAIFHTLKHNPIFINFSKDKIIMSTGCTNLTTFNLHNNIFFSYSITHNEFIDQCRLNIMQMHLKEKIILMMKL